jgi:hypothetical protein
MNMGIKVSNQANKDGADMDLDYGIVSRNGQEV